MHPRVLTSMRHSTVHSRPPPCCTHLPCCHTITVTTTHPPLTLIRFATTYTGKYSVSVPDAGAFYPSSNWMDDVAYNALWLFIR